MHISGTPIYFVDFLSESLLQNINTDCVCVWKTLSNTKAMKCNIPPPTWLPAGRAGGGRTLFINAPFIKSHSTEPWPCVPRCPLNSAWEVNGAFIQSVFPLFCSTVLPLFPRQILPALHLYRTVGSSDRAWWKKERKNKAVVPGHSNYPWSNILVLDQYFVENFMSVLDHLFCTWPS